VLCFANAASWSYGNIAAWYNINTLCGTYNSGGGNAQSPIDIKRQTIFPITGQVTFSTDYWGKTGLSILNNGHALKVAGEWGHIMYNGVQYDAAQFHFHQPSEHTFDGMHYDMEMHIVHLNKTTGGFLVLGFLFMIGDENNFLHNLGYADFFDDHQSKNIGGDVNIMDIINASNDWNYGMYTYDGSFTTPPCTEGVNWIVFRKVQTLSKAQWDGYAYSMQQAGNTISYSTGTGTFRPAQPIGDRNVYLKWAKIQNGDPRFTQVEVFGLSFGVLIGVVILASVYAMVIKKVIAPKAQQGAREI
jgi:carbonic anhydrase